MRFGSVAVKYSKQSRVEETRNFSNYIVKLINRIKLVRYLTLVNADDEREHDWSWYQKCMMLLFCLKYLVHFYLQQMYCFDCGNLRLDRQMYKFKVNGASPGIENVKFI